MKRLAICVLFQASRLHTEQLVADLMLIRRTRGRLPRMRTRSATLAAMRQLPLCTPHPCPRLPYAVTSRARVAAPPSRGLPLGDCMGNDAGGFEPAAGTQQG